MKIFESVSKARPHVTCAVVILLFKRIFTKLGSQSIYTIAFTKLHVHVYLVDYLVPQSFQNLWSAPVEALWKAVNYTMTFTGHFDGYKTKKTNESFLQSWLLIEIFSSSDNEIQHHKWYIHCCESSYNWGCGQ